MDQGKTIQSRYEIQSYRASNSAIELYDAIDRQLDRPITLQIVHEALASDEPLASAFDAHQKIGLSLYNCSVLAIYDVGRQDGRAFSVMERFKPLVPADYLLRDNSPDLQAVLRLTRQVAESLACCRDAGLHDWSFSPEAVGLAEDGNIRLAIIEQRTGASADDAAALDVTSVGNFLAGLLASGAPLDRVALPASVSGLLARIEGTGESRFASLNDMAAAIGSIEQLVGDPTQAYAPSLTPPPLTSPDAPTLAAAIADILPVPESGIEATRDLDLLHLGSATTVVPDTAMNPAYYANRSAPNSKRPVMIGIVGAVALVLILFALLPRLVDGQGALTTGKPATPTAITTATTIPMVAAPELKGLTLDEAKILASGYNLAVVPGVKVETSAVPPDKIAAQEPPVGTLLQSGSVITVSLSMAAVAVNTPVPPTAVVQPVVQQPAAPPPAVDNGKKNDDKGKGKSKGKDK